MLTRRLPVIAVTAWAMEDEVKRASDAAYDAVLPKPCAPEALLVETLATDTTLILSTDDDPSGI